MIHISGGKDVHGVQCHYSTIDILQNTCKRHPIVHPCGWGLRCLLWVSNIIYVRLSCLTCLSWCISVINNVLYHYGVVIMSIMASLVTSISIVYSTVCSNADQRKHQSSASLAFVRGCYRWPVNSPHNGPVTRKMFPFDDVIMIWVLTHWGRIMNICISKLTIIGSDNGLSPGRHHAIIWTNAGILFIGPFGTNFSAISIRIQTFSLKKMHLKMLSGKWHPFCLGLNVLMV